MSGPRVGVLALQGDFEAHARTLRQLGAEVTEVRIPAELDGLDGLVIPGGESTTIVKGIESARLGPALRAHHESCRPILGTCAGLIVCDAARRANAAAALTVTRSGAAVSPTKAELDQFLGSRSLF